MQVFFEKATIGYWVSSTAVEPGLGKVFRRAWQLRKPADLPSYQEFIAQRRAKNGLDADDRFLSVFA
jgi:hypothetical protein